MKKRLLNSSDLISGKVNNLTDILPSAYFKVGGRKKISGYVHYKSMSDRLAQLGVAFSAEEKEEIDGEVSGGNFVMP